eukprot:scaffold75326_cov23-Tisochrysis_lutea.AAC.2
MRSVLDSTVIRQGCACRGALGQPSCCSCAAHAPMGSVLDGNGLLNTAIGTGPSGCTCCSTYAWDHAARTQRTVVRQCDHAVLMRKLTKGEWGRRHASMPVGRFLPGLRTQLQSPSKCDSCVSCLVYIVEAAAPSACLPAERHGSQPE